MPTKTLRRHGACRAILLAIALNAHAAQAAQAAPVGMMTLAVDATDTDHQVFSMVETIPVGRAGALTLLYPRWEIGSHAPTATVAELAGLQVTSDDKPLAWQRDPVDTHAFHLDVPAGARLLRVRMQFLAPRWMASLRPGMVVLPWHRLLLYPAGYPVAALRVQAQVKLPPGLELSSALKIADVADGSVRFAPTSLDALVDAPVYAARYHQALALGNAGVAPVTLDLLADDPASMALTPAHIAQLRALPVQAGHIFGPPPFTHYRALVTLSDVYPSAGGIEHLEEGENNLPANYFTDYAHQLPNRDLVAHEYVHAWNGIYRRPADLWSANYNEPLRGSLLWVYEGQAEFWGRVLAARTGMRTEQETLDKLAVDAALVAQRKGRSWKSLADSLNDALYMAGHSVSWRDWQRREDYYTEGVLLWLDVEARLRAATGGRLGLDDFARRFFRVDGKQVASHTVSHYTFDDVCRDLNALAPGDWRAILQRHLDSHEDADALAGLARAGWHLIYTATPSESFRQEEAADGARNLAYSIGLQVSDKGAVRAVSWDGPAFRAGLAPGARLLHVNGAPFDADRLEQAVALSAQTPLVLEFEQDGRRRSVSVDYHGPLRYPRLERVAGTEDYLSPLLKAR